MNDAHNAAAAADGRPAPHREICLAFLKLGILSFGGPIAHLGYFHAEFVRRRRWLDDAAYADLVALCQFLPGPASSQVAFALGMRRGGLLGAIAASVCFLLPSAALMIALGCGMSVASGLRSAGWIHGLMLAAVAVVAQAVSQMGAMLCADARRIALCLLSAAAALTLPTTSAQVIIIAGGALAGWLLHRREVHPPADDHAPRSGHGGAAAALAAFVALLLAMPWIASLTGSRALVTFDAFYRAGALVFGGGHVVLPLLRATVVAPGWISDDAFIAGYGAAQAVPGPLFSFAGYLGAVMDAGAWAWLQGAWCLLAIFLPGWLLVAGALPFWHRWRSRAWAQACLLGANAAVVGILLAALCSPLIAESVRTPLDAAVCLLALGTLRIRRMPPALVVLGCAGAGWLLHLS
jgi:chromate transporter